MTHFPRLQAKAMRKEYDRAQAAVERAEAEMAQVSSTDYEIPAHGDSEYKAANHKLQIVSAAARRTVQNAQIEVSDNLDSYVAAAKQDMEHAEASRDGSVPANPHLHLP